MLPDNRLQKGLIREHGVCGVVGETLTLTDALTLGRLLGRDSSAQGRRIAVVGYDARQSSPDLERELCRGLTLSGLYVLRLGHVPTPVLSFASWVFEAPVSVMVTGEDAPPEMNGFKILVENTLLWGDSLHQMVQRAVVPSWGETRQGLLVEYHALSAYIQRLLKEYVRAPLRVAWGAQSLEPCVSSLIAHLQGQHVLVAPVAVEETVREKKCDLGFILEGNGERLTVVGPTGRIVPHSQLLSLFVSDVLRSSQGEVVLDAQTSFRVFDEVKRCGGTLYVSSSRHMPLDHTLQARKGCFAGDAEGRLAFADTYYGFNDALYAAVRLITLLAIQEVPLKTLLKKHPRSFVTPNIHVWVPDGRKVSVLQSLKHRALREGWYVYPFDGVRVKDKEGWWYLKPSEQKNALTVRCEARSEKALHRLKQSLKALLEAEGLSPSL